MYHGDPSHSGLSQSMPNVSGSPAGHRVDQAGRRGVRLPDRGRRRDRGGDRERLRLRLRRARPAALACPRRLPVTLRRAACATSTRSASPAPRSTARRPGTCTSSRSTTEGRARLIALDLHTGKVRWRKSVDLPDRRQRRCSSAVRWPSPARSGPVRRPGRRLLGLQGPRRRRPARRHRDRSCTTRLPADRAASGIRPARRWTRRAPRRRVRERLELPGDAYDHTNSVLELSPSARCSTRSRRPTGPRTTRATSPRLAGRGPGRHEMGGARRQVRAVYVLRQGHLGGIAARSR